MILLVNCQRECRRECRQDWKGGLTFLLCPLSFCHFTTALVCPLSFCHFFVLSFCHFTTAVVCPLSFFRPRSSLSPKALYPRSTPTVQTCFSACVPSLYPGSTPTVKLAFQPVCHNSTPDLPRLLNRYLSGLPLLSNLLFSLCAITLLRIYPAF